MQRNEKYLCCLTSSTLLNIVSKHEIHFGYQEVAIIKKFNLALQNTDVFGSEPEESEEADSSCADDSSLKEEEQIDQQLEEMRRLVTD